MGSPVTCVMSFLTNLSSLRPSILDLWSGTGQTDRQMTASNALRLHLMGVGIIKTISNIMQLFSWMQPHSIIHIKYSRLIKISTAENIKPYQNIVFTTDWCTDCRLPIFHQRLQNYIHPQTPSSRTWLYLQYCIPADSHEITTLQQDSLRSHLCNQ